MTNNLTRIKERRRALEERVEAAKREKRNIEDRVQEQLRKLREREINKWEYDDRLRRLFSERSAEEWVDYYNQYILTCRIHIKNCDLSIRRERRKRLAFVAAPVLLIGLVFLGLSMFGVLDITGRSVEEIPDDVVEEVEEVSIPEEVEEEVSEEEVEDVPEEEIVEEEPEELEEEVEEPIGEEPSEEEEVPGNETEEETEEPEEIPGNETEEVTEEPTEEEEEPVEEPVDGGEEPTEEPEEIPEEDEETDEAPVLLTQIPDISIKMNAEFELNLNDFFSNVDSFFLRQASNITSTTFDHTLKITPDENFVGTREVKIIVTNEFGSAESNDFNITVFEIVGPPELIQEIPDINIEINGQVTLSITDYFSSAENYFLLQITNISTKTFDHTIGLIPNENFVGTRESKIIVTNEFGNAESNFFEIRVGEVSNVTLPSVFNLTGNVSVFRRKAKAVINRPQKRIEVLEAERFEDLLNISVELPLEAMNISIKTGEEVRAALDEMEAFEETVKNADKEDLVSGFITGNVAYDVKKSKGILTRFWEWVTGFTITGQAISEEELEADIRETENAKVVDLENIVEQTRATDIGVEYYVSGPSTVESDISNGKRVIVSGADELNYTDVLAFTDIPEVFNVGQESRIRILWREQNEYVDFIALDLDNNGKLDYVEWLAPHLSNQTFDIIFITRAEHLDSSRELINDIFEEVRELDGNWSETIGDGEYVRVTFEISLDSSRDITLWPRTVSGEPRIEVYEFNGTELIAEFTSINDNEYNTILLTNLQGEPDTFDLRVVDGSVELDHIIDPAGHTNTLLEPCTDSGSGCDPGDSNVGAIKQFSYTVGITGGTNDIDAEFRLRFGASIDTSDTAGTNLVDGSCASADFAINSVSIINNVATSGCDTVLEWNAGGDYIDWDSQGTAECGASDSIVVNFTVEACSSASGGYDFDLVCVKSGGVVGCWMDGASEYVEDWDIIAAGDSTSPGVTINFPANNTYSSSDYPLNFNVTLSENGAVQYSLDGGINNVSMFNSSALQFNFTNGSIADGSYTFSVYANDTAGNNNYSESIDFSFDGTPPNVTVNFPANVTYGTANLPLNFNVTLEGNGSVQYSLDGGINNFTMYNITGAGVIGFEMNATNGSIADGSYTINFYANNSLGNNNYSESIDFSFDGTSPGVTIDFPANNTYGSSDYPLNFNVTLSENGAVQYSLDGGINNVSMFNSSALQFNFTNGSIADGSYTINFYANDTIGNNNYSESIDFSFDGTPPNVTINFPANNTYGTGDLPLNFNVTLEGNGSVQYSLDGGINNFTMYNITGAGVIGFEMNATNGSIADGSYTINFYANNSLGNNNYSESIDFSFDGTSPGVTINFPEGAAYSASDLPLNFNVTLSENGAAQYSLDGGINNITMFNSSALQFNFTNGSIADGSYTINFYANDTVGNNNYSENIGFVFDSTASSVNFSLPTPANASGQTETAIYINFTTSDSNDHYSFLEVDNDILLWMTFDDINATADPTDLSSYSNNGTAFNNANQTDKGYFGKGYDFDSGHEDYVNITNSGSLQVSQNFSVSLWVNATIGSAQDSVFGKSNSDFDFACLGGSGDTGFGLVIVSDGTLMASWCNGTGISKYNTTTADLSSVWHHVVMVYNGTGTALYLDGGLNKTGTLSGSVGVTNQLVLSSQSNTVSFEGQLDEFIIFNRSLDVNEVAALYNASVSQYFRNFTSLSVATYTFTGHAVDIVGNRNQTEDRQVTIAAPADTFPYMTLNEPANNSNFGINKFNITLNTTVYDLEDDLIDVRIYGINSSSTGDIYKHGLLYQQFGVANGTEIEYNWTAAPVVPDSSNVLLFHFDNNSDYGENQTLVYDFSNYNLNNGTFAGSSAPNVSVSGGKFGGGFVFSVIKSHINISSSTSLDFDDGQDYTWATWVKLNQINRDHWIFKKEGSTCGIGCNGYLILVEDDNTVSIAKPGGGSDESVNQVSSVGTLTVDRWHHIAVAFNSESNIKIYIDGAEDGSGSGDFDDDTSANLILGDTDSRALNGTLDEVAIWNRTLSAMEIRNLYRLNADTYYWKVNVTDDSASTNNNESELRQFTIDNNAPTVPYVSPIADVDPTEDGIVNIKFNVTVDDSDGFGEIKSVDANFTKTGLSIVRSNSSCNVISGQDTATSRNYSCSIGMWYFDQSGEWNITVRGVDYEDSTGINNSVDFTYKLLTAFKINSQSFSFAGNIGDQNVTPNDDPIVLNNTGNYNITNISIEGIDLWGDNVSTIFIGVANISIGLSTSGGASPLECAATNPILSNGTFVNVSQSLPAGNHSVNDFTTAQEQLYLCLKIPPPPPSQSYSTTSAGSWTIKIALAAFALGGGEAWRRRKKKGKKKLIEELEKKLKRRKKLGIEELTALDEEFRKNYGMSMSELLSLRKKILKAEEIKIPIDIFREEIGASEALSKYLKENEGMKYSEIADLIGRDQRTVWINYNNAVKKMKGKIKVKKKVMKVPAEIFSDRRLSVSEAVVNYLREKGMRNSEIAKLLDKDPRNVWTLYSRAVRKLDK